MSCPGITDILTRETGRYLPGAIFRDIFPTSLWIALFTQLRGVFPNNLSEIVTNLTYGRNAPDVAEPEWTAMTIEDGQEGGSCLPPTDTIQFGSKPRSFQLFRRAINGPDFCAENFRSTFDLNMQLNNLSSIMQDRIRIEWEIHDRSEYQRMTDLKVVVNDCDNPSEDDESSGTATYPAVEATQIPGLGFFERYGLRLMRNGAAQSAMLMSNGGPIFTLITGPEFARNLKRSNAELRDDIRWADAGNSAGARLLAPFGVNYTLENFMFANDLMPRRFNWNGTAHVQVPQFLKYADSKGWSYKVNPAWNTAGEEEILLYDPMVMEQLVPEPIVAPAANFKFNPVSYLGEIGIRNIPNKDCNPDSNIIFHRMIMAASSMPKKPNRGASFLIKRCGFACDNTTSCSS